jgi:hypothetical protein
MTSNTARVGETCRLMSEIIAFVIFWSLHLRSKVEGGVNLTVKRENQSLVQKAVTVKMDTGISLSHQQLPRQSED